MTTDVRVTERVETLAQRIWRLTLAQGRAWRRFPVPKEGGR